MTKEQIIDLSPPQNKILQKILRQQIPNKTVWAFGSRVEWKASETSDLDLVAHKCSGAEIADLKEALEESALHCSVDVLNWEDIPDSFRANIKKHYVVVQQNTVPEGWRVVKLRDIITLNYGASLPKEKRVWGNIPVYSSAGLIGWHNKPLINQQGIIVGRKGTVGSIHRSKKPFFAIDTSFYISETDTDCDIGFLFYMLSKLGLNYLNSDSAVPGLNRETAYDQNALIPPLPEQKAIAEVLSSLDDKIDLLQRQNKTLEGMAQTLFRKWFLEDAGDDWEVATVKDVCSKIQSGGTPSTKISEYYGGAINWYKTKELKDNFLLESETKITQEGLANSAANLFHENSIIIAIYAAPTVGRLGILANTAAFNQAACGLVADENKVCYEYLYLHFLSSRNTLLSMASGAAQQNLNVHFIQHFNIILPPKGVMKNFCGIVRPMFMKMKASQSQIRALEELRDALLPRLMSGVVRVKKS